MAQAPRPTAGALSRTDMSGHGPRGVLEAAFHAAVAAADPAAATRSAVAGLDTGTAAIRIIALGKAAPAMAAGARRAVETGSGRITGGLVVTHARGSSADHGLPTIIGDHPVPGARSAAAAARLGEALSAALPDEDALVLVSGGGTSLIAAPVDGVPEHALAKTFEVLLGSGADIVTMNALRKRLLRWGAGRLALALRTRRVECLIASDVLDAGAESVASGPCSPDPMTALQLQALMRAHALEAKLPSSVRNYLDAVAAGRSEETPKPPNPRFATTAVRVILDFHAALAGAAGALRAAGAGPVEVERAPLRGEAALEGERFAARLVAWRDGLPAHPGRTHSSAALVVAGETTVTGAPSDEGAGGRCQEFALACARALHRMGSHAAGLNVLAAGTDGRDGPTDAAGAVIDVETWARIEADGGAPTAALATHRSHHALDRAGALLRTGPTGTNVNDLVIGLIAPEASESR